MVSRCCRADMTVDGHTTHYYVCDRCGRACDGMLSFDLGAMDEEESLDDINRQCV